MLSLLMVATLLWGGCISCPQFFMFPTAKAEKSCCQKNGQCERPTKTTPQKDCKRMAVEPQNSASANVELAFVPLVETALGMPESLERCFENAHPEALVSEHSPPDLNVLNSTFII
jgi:hypothetical protein